MRRNKKQRAFNYVLKSEIELLAKLHKTAISEMWNMFRDRDYIITEVRMDAERRYAEIADLPF